MFTGLFPARWVAVPRSSDGIKDAWRVSWGRRTERASRDQYCSRTENSECCDLSAIK